MSKGDTVVVFYRLSDKVEKVTVTAEKNGESIDIRQPDTKRGETMLSVVTLDKNKNDRNNYMFDRASVVAMFDMRSER